MSGDLLKLRFIVVPENLQTIFHIFLTIFRQFSISHDGSMVLLFFLVWHGSHQQYYPSHVSIFFTSTSRILLVWGIFHCNQQDASPYAVIPTSLLPIFICEAMACCNHQDLFRQSQRLFRSTKATEVRKSLSTNGGDTCLRKGRLKDQLRDFWKNHENLMNVGGYLGVRQFNPGLFAWVITYKNPLFEGIWM